MSTRACSLPARCLWVWVWVDGWVGGWVGGCVCVCVGDAYQLCGRLYCSRCRLLAVCPLFCSSSSVYQCMRERIPTHARACAPQAFDSQASTIFSKTAVSTPHHDAELVKAFHKTILQELSRCACTRVHRE